MKKKSAVDLNEMERRMVPDLMSGFSWYMTNIFLESICEKHPTDPEKYKKEFLNEWAKAESGAYDSKLENMRRIGGMTEKEEKELKLKFRESADSVTASLIGVKNAKQT